MFSGTTWLRVPAMASKEGAGTSRTQTRPYGGIAHKEAEVFCEGAGPAWQARGGGVAESGLRRPGGSRSREPHVRDWGIGDLRTMGSTRYRDFGWEEEARH